MKVITKFSVKDFDQWLKVFNENQNLRVEAGAKNTQVFRGAEDPNEVAVLMEWNDPEKARAFAQSPELREVQQKSGVSSKTDAYVLKAMG